MATSSWNPPATAQVGEPIDLNVSFVTPANTGTSHDVDLDGIPLISEQVSDFADEEFVLDRGVGRFHTQAEEDQFNASSLVDESNGNLIVNEPGTYTLTIDDFYLNESVEITVTQPPKPDFSITNCSTPNTAVVGEPVTTTATLTNSGDADGTATVAVFVDGGEIERTSQPVSAGAQEAVGFELTFQSPTEASVSVELV